MRSRDRCRTGTAETAAGAQQRREPARHRYRSTGRPRETGVQFDNWVSRGTGARIYSAPAIATFAAWLEVDGSAVRAAVTQPWSSDQAEGQIHRTKLLKRQSYGRSSFDLLRRRDLIAA